MQRGLNECKVCDQPVGICRRGHMDGRDRKLFLPRISGQNPIRQQILKLTQAGVAFGAVTDELIKSFEHKFGLDKPPSEQYLIYLGNLVRLDLGISIANYPTRVDKIIGAALPWTIGLLGFTTIFSVVIGSHLVLLSLGTARLPGSRFWPCR